MPPNEQTLAKALAALQQVELGFFSANPATIAPFGSSELRWSVKAPHGAQIKLDGQAVARTGSRSVRPTESRVFRLTAHASTLSAEVARQTVHVDLQSCVSKFISEEEVQDALAVVVASMLAESPQVKNRAAPFIDVTPAGIVLKLRFVVKVKKARNPDFNVDALIGLGIDNNGIVPFFKEFKADLDFSFWEDVLNFTVGAFLGGPFLHLAIAIAESNAQDKARSDILNGVAGAVDAFLSTTPAGWAPHKLELRDDGLDVRVCPRSGFTTVSSFRDSAFRLRAVRKARRGARTPRRASTGRASTGRAKKK